MRTHTVSDEAYPKLNGFLTAHTALLKQYENAACTPSKYQALSQKINLLNRHQLRPQSNHHGKPTSSDPNNDNETEQGFVRGLFKMFEGLNEQQDNKRANRNENKKTAHRLKTTQRFSGGKSLHVNKQASIAGKIGDFECKGVQISEKSIGNPRLRESNGSIRDSVQFRRSSSKFRQTPQPSSGDIMGETRRQRHCEQNQLKKYHLLKDYSLAAVIEHMPIFKNVKRSIQQGEQKVKKKLNAKWDRIKRGQENNQVLTKQVRRLQKKAQLCYGVDFNSAKVHTRDSRRRRESSQNSVADFLEESSKQPNIDVMKRSSNRPGSEQKKCSIFYQPSKEARNSHDDQMGNALLKKAQLYIHNPSNQASAKKITRIEELPQQESSAFLQESSACQQESSACLQQKEQDRVKQQQLFEQQMVIREVMLFNISEGKSMGHKRAETDNYEMQDWSVPYNLIKKAPSSRAVSACLGHRIKKKVAQSLYIRV